MAAPAQYRTGMTSMGVFPMSPGPLTSSTRGGLSFQHGGSRNFNHGHRTAPFYGTRQAPHSVGRIYGAARQRFSVAPNDAGGSTLTLSEDEVVTVGTNEDGSVTIAIDPKSEPEPEPENGEGNDAADMEFDVIQRRRGPTAAST